MKMGIIGLPGSGKSTVFEALIKEGQTPAKVSGNMLVTVTVPDQRIAFLSDLYKPKKTIYAQIEFMEPGPEASGKDESGVSGLWNVVRNCDALIHVIKNYDDGTGQTLNPAEDIKKLDSEMVFADFMVVEKKLERLDHEVDRGKKVDEELRGLLHQCHEKLSADEPLRYHEFSSAPPLRGFGFVSAKPVLFLFNNGDEDGEIPGGLSFVGDDSAAAIRGQLESELTQMSAEEAKEFMDDFGIKTLASDRVIQKSYDLLGLISFFTVGEDEVRAWTIKNNTDAVDAAEVIHSDIKKGFIRAETVSYDDIVECGNFQEAKKKGKVRLEGKTYKVLDGDIINYRFNV